MYLCVPCFCICHIEVISIFWIGPKKRVLVCAVKEQRMRSRLDRAYFICMAQGWVQEPEGHLNLNITSKGLELHVPHVLA